MTASDVWIAPTGLPPLLRACRPRQWSKNFLVLAAPLAAGLDRVAGRIDDVFLTVVGFVALSCAVYLWNDLADVHADRAHPTKCLRPIAAGDLGALSARVAAVLLAAAGLLLPLASGDVDAMLIMLSYLAASIAYSLRLKHVPILELAIVASGFVLRTLAGAAAADVPVSRWFAIVVSAAAVYVVSTKRFVELRDRDVSQQRRVLAQYTLGALNEIRFASASVALVGYVLWAFEKAGEHASQASVLFELTCIPVALALFRFANAVHLGGGEAPEEIILKDRQILIYGVVWFFLFVVAVNTGLA